MWRTDFFYSNSRYTRFDVHNILESIEHTIHTKRNQNVFNVFIEKINNFNLIAVIYVNIKKTNPFSDFALSVFIYFFLGKSSQLKNSHQMKRLNSDSKILMHDNTHTHLILPSAIKLDSKCKTLNILIQLCAICLLFAFLFSSSSNDSFKSCFSCNVRVYAVSEARENTQKTTTQRECRQYTQIKKRSMTLNNSDI